jgi:hypothetical protein
MASIAGFDTGGDSGDEVGGVGIELIGAIVFQRVRYLAYVFCTSPIARARFTLDWLKRYSASI